MNNIKLVDAVNNGDDLTEEERRALRGSRFAPLPPPSSCSDIKSNPRIAHPGGPVATNKAVALAKFLQRKLENSSGDASLDPDLVEAAVRNAKASLCADVSSSDVKVRHVEMFSDSEEESEGPLLTEPKLPAKKKKRKKKKKKNGLSDCTEQGGLSSTQGDLPKTKLKKTR